MIRLIGFFCLFSLTLAGQKPLLPSKHSIKVNALGLAGGLGSIQYERMLHPLWSVTGTFFGRFKSDVPLGSTLNSLANRYGESIIGVNFEYIQVDRSQIGLVGFSPEIRRYFGKKNTRFFLSGFYQYENLDLTVPADLVIQLNEQFYNSIIPVSFDVKTSSFGLLPGIQFRKGRWGVDWTILGPRTGHATYLQANAQQSLLNRLSDEEKQFLIQGVKERFKLSDEYFLVGIEGSNANISAIKRVPYWLVRGFGVNVSYQLK